MTATSVIERGTIYWGTAFSYRKMEAREITVEIGRSAQFAAAIIVIYTEKGRRRRSQLPEQEAQASNAPYPSSPPPALAWIADLASAAFPIKS